MRSLCVGVVIGLGLLLAVSGLGFIYQDGANSSWVISAASPAEAAQLEGLKGEFTRNANRPKAELAGIFQQRNALYEVIAARRKWRVKKPAEWLKHEGIMAFLDDDYTFTNPVFEPAD